MKVTEDKYITVFFPRSLARRNQEVLGGEGKGPHTLSHSPLYGGEQWYALPTLVVAKEHPGGTGQEIVRAPEYTEMQWLKEISLPIREFGSTLFNNT